MILGIDWLKSYGQVTFDFQQNAITISKEGQPLVLRGIGEKAQLKILTANQWYQEYPFGECCVLQQCNNTQDEQEMPLNPELSMLLDQYPDIFEEPKGLPPQRKEDHRIPLQPGTMPVNLRPYRHSHEQKSEVERQVREMLETSIIQTSNNTFASPVLLVKKKDGSWRMCVDYRISTKPLLKISSQSLLSMIY